MNLVLTRWTVLLILVLLIATLGRNRTYWVILPLIFFILLFAETALWIYNPQRTLHQYTHPSLYGVSFNESQFPPRLDVPEYWDTVHRGYQKMKKSTIIFCGLARDICDRLPMFFARIKSLQKRFKQLQIVIYENGSKDSTRQILQQYSECVILPTEQHEAESVTPGKTRMERMVYLRNQLLEYLSVLDPRPDYVAMIDVDLWGPTSHDGIAHSFGSRNLLLWDSISAYGVSGSLLTLNQLCYYDGFAYKPYQLPTPLLGVSSMYEIINSCLVSGVSRGNIPWRVESGFGGLALYTIAAALSGRYKYEPGVCEHITFHHSLTDKGYDRHYVNPNMLILSGQQGPTDGFFH